MDRKNIKQRQNEDREKNLKEWQNERISIMVADGEMSEFEAEQECQRLLHCRQIQQQELML